MELTALGWDDHFARHFQTFARPDLTPARVVQEHRERYVIWTEYEELWGKVSGKYRHRTVSRAEYPAVGDWVLVKSGGGDATIHAVLPRRSSFSRKAVLAGGPTQGMGRTEEQVLAANIDTVFLVSGLDNDWNPRRIERFLVTAHDSGASPVIVLNKADVCAGWAERVKTVAELAPGVPVYPMSAVNRTGLESLRAHLDTGRTAVFLGSSGVGKSTIINGLLGEDRLDTGGVRLDDSKGRHTTTRRELLLLPDGGLVIDTPGLRRIQTWDDDTGIERTYADIEQLVTECRFSDCRHESEPGCAIREAINSGVLDAARFAGYVKLQKEMRSLAVRKDVRQQKENARAWDRRTRRILKEREELKKKGLI